MNDHTNIKARLSKKDMSNLERLAKAEDVNTTDALRRAITIASFMLDIRLSSRKLLVENTDGSSQEVLFGSPPFDRE